MTNFHSPQFPIFSPQITIIILVLLTKQLTQQSEWTVDLSLIWIKSNMTSTLTKGRYIKGSSGVETEPL